MNATERSVFFKKDPAQNGAESTIVQLGNEFDDAHDHKNLKELSSMDKTHSKDNDATKQSDVVKQLFDESLSAVKEFNDSKLKLVYKQLEEEKQLTKKLNDKLQSNLSKISEIDKLLENKRNQLEIQLDEKTQNLIRAEKLVSIGELSSRLAHDMKNPLTTIKNTIQLLRTRQGQQIDEYVLKRFDLLDDSIFRMSHQIDAVLDYVKQTPLIKKPESLLDIIKHSLLPLNIPKHITLNLPTKDVLIYCDSIKMEVVFGNLLLNAIQAIRDKSGQIYIRYAEQSSHVIIEITDSGPGIAPENQTKIFDPLFTTKQEGTGLGLTSCRSIIEQHGGTIQLKSCKPTSFLMTIPKPNSANPVNAQKITPSEVKSGE